MYFSVGPFSLSLCVSRSVDFSSVKFPTDPSGNSSLVSTWRISLRGRQAGPKQFSVGLLLFRCLQKSIPFSVGGLKDHEA